MCRLLCVKSETKFSVSLYLKQLAAISKNSKEYQGHGWGYAICDNSKWKFYHNIKPIWEDELNINETGTILLAHARSAFENKEIKVENNMPFQNGNFVYIFNGELHGVRIKEEGRIGAEKIFNFFMRFDNGSMTNTLTTGLSQLEKRTKFLKACNMIVADSNQICVVSKFNAEPDYYTLHSKKETNRLIVCSGPFPDEPGWTKMTQGVYRVA